jgi:hypothetical protein
MFGNVQNNPARKRTIKLREVLAVVASFPGTRFIFVATRLDVKLAT